MPPVPARPSRPSCLGERGGGARGREREKGNIMGNGKGRAVESMLKGRKAAVVALCACVVAVVAAAVLWAWQPWGAGGDAGDPVEGDKGFEGGATQPSASSGGDDIVCRDNYANDDEYVQALIEVGKRQVEIPREDVWEDEGHTVGYYAGCLSVDFYRTCEEDRAREIVAECGGLWVSDTFGWGTGIDTASVEAYFPDFLYDAALQERQEMLRSYDEVESAAFCAFAKNLDQEVLEPCEEEECAAALRR